MTHGDDSRLRVGGLVDEVNPVEGEALYDLVALAAGDVLVGCAGDVLAADAAGNPECPDHNADRPPLAVCEPLPGRIIGDLGCG